MTPPITLIFDLDGTLIETAPDLCAAMNATLEHAGRCHVSLDDVRLMVGQGAKALIRKGMAHTGPQASEEDIEKLFPVFMDYYSRHISDHSHPYPHLLDILDLLKKQQYNFAICTNKPEEPARLLLEELDMSHWFSSVIGGDSLPLKKPEAAPLITAAQKAGGDISRSIMIGDSKTDVDAARAADIPVIGVSFGYTETPMIDLKPDFLIDSFQELPKALEDAIKLF